MRLASFCIAIAVFVSFGLPQLQSGEEKKGAKPSEEKKDSKPEAKKDSEAKGKIPEAAQKIIKENKVLHGVVVIEVTVDGPSQMGREKPKDAGDVIMLEEGDIITHVDGKEIKTAADYHKLMSGNEEKKVTVIDVNSGKSITDYFKPKEGRLEIVFEVITPPLG
jgi:S1-C subfamily serine protease